MNAQHAHINPPARPPRRQTAVDLLLATNALQEAIHKLTEPTPSYVNNVYLEIPGLYAQLWQAMSTYRNEAASSTARSRPPVLIEGLEVKRRLDIFIDSLPCGCAGTTYNQLAALASRGWEVEDIRQIQWITRKLGRFAEDIERLINQDHVKEITVPCPACGVEYVERLDGGNNIVYSYALQASAEYGCTCQNCGYHWAPNQLMQLATDANLPAPQGVTR